MDTQMPTKTRGPLGSGQFASSAEFEESRSSVQESRVEAQLQRDVKEPHLKTRGQYRDAMAMRVEPRIAKSF